MAKELKLNAHPRLYLGSDEMERVKRDPQASILKSAADRVKHDAARFAKLPPLTYPRNVHNGHLHRAREVQTRVITLLVRCGRTWRC